jgi:hypothetical protein
MSRERMGWFQATLLSGAMLCSLGIKEVELMQPSFVPEPGYEYVVDGDRVEGKELLARLGDDLEEGAEEVVERTGEMEEADELGEALNEAADLETEQVDDDLEVEEVEVELEAEEVEIELDVAEVEVEVDLEVDEAGEGLGAVNDGSYVPDTPPTAANDNDPSYDPDTPPTAANDNTPPIAANDNDPSYEPDTPSTDTTTQDVSSESDATSTSSNTTSGSTSTSDAAAADTGAAAT